jgi:predicted nucleic acid-binding protein
LIISQTVIDASFLLKLFFSEEQSDKAYELWSSWIEDSIEVVAPTLIVFECASVIRNKVHRKLLNEAGATEIIERIKRLDMTLVYTEEILEGAWDIGRLLKMPALYDCFYLSLAQFLKTPLWTADRKLYQTAHALFPSLNLL